MKPAANGRQSVSISHFAGFPFYASPFPSPSHSHSPCPCPTLLASSAICLPQTHIYVMPSEGLTWLDLKAARKQKKNQAGKHLKFLRRNSEKQVGLRCQEGRYTQKKILNQLIYRFNSVNFFCSYLCSKLYSSLSIAVSNTNFFNFFKMLQSIFRC